MPVSTRKVVVVVYIHTGLHGCQKTSLFSPAGNTRYSREAALVTDSPHRLPAFTRPLPLVLSVDAPVALIIGDGLRTQKSPM